MAEAKQTFTHEPSADAETTLIAPRFDEREAQTAQPVVPLATVARRRRVWPLLLISALLGGTVSIFGLYLYQRERARAVVAQPATRQQTPTPAPAATPNAQPQPAQSATES